MIMNVTWRRLVLIPAVLLTFGSSAYVADIRVTSVSAYSR
jgi:hypothetical protein